MLKLLTVTCTFVLCKWARPVVVLEPLRSLRDLATLTISRSGCRARLSLSNLLIRGLLVSLCIDRPMYMKKLGLRRLSYCGSLWVSRCSITSFRSTTRFDLLVNGMNLLVGMVMLLCS